MVSTIYTRMLVRTVNAMVVLLGALSSEAQISFQSVSMDGSMIGPKTLFHTSLLNVTVPCEVVLDGYIRTRDGQEVLSFKTDPVRIGTGVTTLASSGLTMRTFNYGHSDAGRSARIFKQLPQGEYRFCVHLTAPQVEAQDEYCDSFEVEHFLFLDLVQPWNGDSIDEVRPALTWALSGSGPTASNIDVRITLAPMKAGHDPAQALASERPVFMLPHVVQRTVLYPPGIAELERGRCYAWQAERLDGGRVVDRSEPWGFCVRKYEEPIHNKYVHLDRIQPGAIYHAVDNKVFFRYDEPYASSQLTCIIHNGKQEVMVPTVLDDRNKEKRVTGARSVGVNLYELDLQPYGLRSGHYDLIVRDEKGRERRLKFRVTH